MGVVQKCKDTLGKDIYQALRKQKLTLKEILFVSEYISNGFVGVKAFMAVYPAKRKSYGASAVEACNLLKLPKISEAIKLIVGSWLDEKKLKLEREIIDRLYAKAFYDPATFFNPDGTVKFHSWEEIPEKDRCVVESMEVKYYGKDANTRVVVIKLSDQHKALQELSRYVQLYKNGVEGSVELKMSEETQKRLASIFEGVNKEKKSE